MGKEDIFDIHLDEKGKGTVGKFYPLMKLIFWLSIAVEIIVLVNGTIIYFRYRDVQWDVDRDYYWSLRISMVYLIISSILMILQSFYFLVFSRQARESIKINDSFGFNQSFTWIFKSLKITLIVIIINGLYFLYDLFFVTRV